MKFLIPKRPKWIPRWVNLPFLAFVVFIVLLLFFGDNNFMRINEQQEQNDAIAAEIKQQDDSARLYQQKLSELNTDPETLERIAREQYGMKRRNEEVYKTKIP